MRATDVEQQGLSGIKGQSPQQLRKKLTLLSKTYFSLLKSDNLQYNKPAWWDKQLIDQASDVPSIFFFDIFL